MGLIAGSTVNQDLVDDAERAEGENLLPGAGP